MDNRFIDREVIQFLVLLLATIGANYYMPHFVTVFVFLVILVMYFKSDNEPMWLAFFLVTADGVFGFLGRFEAGLQVIPGLPSVEICQIYVVLSVIKAASSGNVNKPFYHTVMMIVGIYILFLIAEGYAIGTTMSMQIQFRIIKEVLPFLLFYSIPKLMDTEYKYTQFFKYLFPVAILAFGAQFFTIMYHDSPLEFFGAKQETRSKILISLEVSKDHTYRGIYNECILIITYLGSLFYLTTRRNIFNKFYLYIIALSIFLSYFISATRGYTFGFLIVFVLYLFLAVKFSPMRLLVSTVLTIVAFIGLLSIPVIKTQFKHSMERMETMMALAQGDMTAGGTLIRISERGPRVMRKWAESPLTGWGFSDYFRENRDMHTGNQTILLHSGIIGGLLMAGFFGYFCVVLFFRSYWLKRNHPYKKALIVFPIFFLGWFFIHSSTQFYFSYALTPDLGFIQAIFFSMGALIYRNSFPDSTDHFIIPENAPV